MPGKPIEIQLDVVSTGAERGLERTSDAMDDLAKSTDKVEDASKDAARVIDRDLTDSLDTVKRKARDAGDALGDDVKRGSRRASEATGEFKNEAKANFSEVASSFSGDMDGAVDLVQGTLGGLVGSIPGIGVAAGIAAGGIGAVWGAVNAEAETTRARITEMADAMIEANSKVLAESVIAEGVRAIATGAEGAAISLKNLHDAAEDTGETEATLARIYAGDEGLRVEALERVREKYREAADDAVSADATVAASGAERMRELGRWQADLILLGDEYDSATSAVDLMRQSNELAGAVSRGQISSTIGEYERLRAEVERVPTDRTTTIRAQIDLTDAERALRNWRPVVTGTFRAGNAVV